MTSRVYFHLSKLNSLSQPTGSKKSNTGYLRPGSRST